MPKNTLINTSEKAAIAESIVNTISSAMFILDDTFHIVTANASFYRIFRLQPSRTAGALLFDICNRQWDTPQLRSILTRIYTSPAAALKYSLPYTFESHLVKLLRMNICLLEQMPGMPPLILFYLYNCDSTL
jgi:two-component system CheB/CheR fusion protein